jgi:DNA-binding transcriptional MocR family regulator
MVTSGNSSALLLLATQLAAQSRTSPPVAVVERPTYAVAVETLAMSGFDIHAVPTDREGMDVDELCQRLEAGALRPDIVYVQPSFHNPTGASLSPRRRQLLIELARAHSFTIIADEAYQLTSFSSEHSPVSLASEDRYGVVVSLGTFSKFFAPGARLGWIESTPQRITLLSNHPTMRSGCGSNPIVAVLVEPLLRDGQVVACLQRYRATLARRSRQLIAAVARRLPDWELFLAPRGGYFLWYRLPEGQDSQALLERVSARDVSFRPGVECAGDREYVRLSFSFHGVEELEEAIDQIAESCRSRH